MTAVKTHALALSACLGFSSALAQPTLLPSIGAGSLPTAGEPLCSLPEPPPLRADWLGKTGLLANKAFVALAEMA